MVEQGKSVRSPPPEEEGVAETTETFLIPLHHLRGGGRKKGVKLIPGRREGWWKAVFKICFYYSLSYPDLIGDKLNFFFSPSSGCFVCGGNW